MELSELMPSIGEMIPYDYAKIQNQEYDAIVESFLANAQSANHPKFINMGGIPGAGKSTFYKTHQWEPHIYLDFDAVMEKIGGYRTDLRLIGSKESFKKWEVVARVIGYEVLRKAVEKRTNIFFDNGGLHNPFLQLLTNINKYDYSTEMHFITCDFETACKRVKAREKKTQRHTSLDMMQDRFKKVNHFLNQYQKVINKLYVYDSSNNRFEQKPIAY